MKPPEQICQKLAEAVKENPGINIFQLREILKVSVLNSAVSKLLKEESIFRKKISGERFYRFFPGKKLILEFIEKARESVSDDRFVFLPKDGYRFTLEFLCAKEGFPEDEKSGQDFAKQFRLFLRGKGKYNFIKDASSRQGLNDVVFYSGWGSHVYAHVAIFDQQVLEDFVGHLVKFAKKYGTLEISERSIELRKDP